MYYFYFLYIYQVVSCNKPPYYNNKKVILNHSANANNLLDKMFKIASLLLNHHGEN